MIRLFLKLYGILIATLAVSFVVQMQLMEYVWRQVAAGADAHVRFLPAFHLLDEALAPLAPGDRAARLAQLSEGIGVATRIEPWPRAVERFGAAGARLASGAIVATERAEGGYAVAKRTPDGIQAVVLEFPGPRARDVRFLTYAVNWAVEFLIVAVLVFFWVRPFWRDLRALHGAADAIGAGRLASRVSVGRFSALVPFAHAFNVMAERIGGLVQSHRSLTSAVSHELRTPLARLRFAQSLALEERSASGKDAWLEKMEWDMRQIDELTTELLGYARLERESPHLQLQTVPAAPWLEDALAEFGGLLPGPAVDISTVVTIDEVRCDPRYLGRAAANLVRNARFHARGAVRVTLEADGARARLIVDDDGPGIPSGDRERVFEPFVRLDPSRSRVSGGFGLGLAISRQIARWHGGEVTASTSPLGGARLSMIW